MQPAGPAVVSKTHGDYSEFDDICVKGIRPEFMGLSACRRPGSVGRLGFEPDAAAPIFIKATSDK